MVSNIAAGGKIVMMHHWDPERALELIERERIATFGGVPAMVMQVLDSPNFKKFDTSSIRGVSYGGAPAPPDLVRRIREAWPVGQPSNGYGLTETSSVTSMNSGADYVAKPDSAGPPVPVCDVAVLPEDYAKEEPDDSVPRGPGVRGELWIKGPNVVRGYWNRPEETAKTFSRGWLHTGDVAQLDDEDFIYIVDRAKDMIIRGGENVYSVQVEAALFEHPAVADVAVIGVPEPTLGEEVGAVVVLRPGAKVTADELALHVKARLAGFMVPTHIWFRSEPLPRNPQGKVLKRELREELVGSQIARGDALENGQTGAPVGDAATFRLDGHVATITYNRPEVLNAINADMRRDLNDAFSRFRDDEDAWVAIVTGSGRAFCAGADLRQGAGSTGEFAGTFWEKPTLNSFESGWEIFKPVIAAVNGYCLGYGLTLATWCDFVLASDRAEFGLPEVRLGVPAIVASIRLPQRINWADAMELLLTGERIDAERARAMGLVWRVVPHETLLDEAHALAQRLAQRSASRPTSHEGDGDADPAHGDARGHPLRRDDAARRRADPGRRRGWSGRRGEPPAALDRAVKQAGSPTPRRCGCRLGVDRAQPESAIPKIWPPSAVSEMIGEPASGTETTGSPAVA